MALTMKHREGWWCRGVMMMRHGKVWGVAMMLLILSIIQWRAVLFVHETIAPTKVDRDDRLLRNRWRDCTDKQRSNATRESDAIIVVNCEQVFYRTSSSFVVDHHADNDNNNHSRIIVAVVSNERRNRDAIRATWAANRTDVFFFATDDAEEYGNRSDLITMHNDFTYSVIGSVLAVSHSLFPRNGNNYDYLFLVPDTFHVDLAQLAAALSTNTRPRHYTKATCRPDDFYCDGNKQPAFALSYDFVGCIVGATKQKNHLAKLQYTPDDTATMNMLANLCHVQPITDDTIVITPLSLFNNDDHMKHQIPQQQTVVSQHTTTVPSSSSSSLIGNPFHTKSMSTANCTPVNPQTNITSSLPTFDDHRSEDDDDDVGMVTISCETFRYRAPKDRIRRSRSRIIIGVLSSAWNTERRRLIRSTWAFDHRTDVYFVVAGLDFATIESEYEAHRDLMWIRREESYGTERSVLPFKSESFFHIIHTTLMMEGGGGDGYDFLFKTDDDSYVNVNALQRALLREGRHPHYWGNCVLTGWPPIRDPTNKWYVSRDIYPEEQYPPYCFGGGYAVSRPFMNCIIRHLSDVRYNPSEDVSIGILAARCNIMPTTDDRIVIFLNKQQRSTMTMKHKIVQHYITSSEDMILHHNSLLTNEEQ